MSSFPRKRGEKKEKKKRERRGKNLKIERRRTDRKKNRNKRERERNTGYDLKGDTRRLSIMMQINVTRGILRSASIFSFFLSFFFSFFFFFRASQVHQSVPISSRAKTFSGKISFADELSIQRHRETNQIKIG